MENDVTVSLEYPNGATGVFVACTHDPLGGVEYVKIFENFANHILNGEELFASMEDGLKEVQLANSIQLSGWTGLAIDHPSNSIEYDKLLEKKITEENR